MRPTSALCHALTSFVLCLVSASCTEDPATSSPNDSDGGTTTSGDAATSVTGGPCFQEPRTLTLVNVLAQDPGGFIATSHEVELIDATTGMAFSPPIKATTGRGTGEFTLQNVPCGARAWIHTKGNGSASDTKSTYDSLNLYVPGSGEEIVRISNSGTVVSVEATSGFVADPERVGVGGAVYSVDATGKHTGTVGCATIHVDEEPHPALKYDQRYVASTGLPTPLDKQGKTLRSGKFYFGNLTTGKHTFRVSLDGGKTFIGQPLELSLPFARKDAVGEFKSVLVLFEIGIPGPNPTPASCQ